MQQASVQQSNMQQPSMQHQMNIQQTNIQQQQQQIPITQNILPNQQMQMLTGHVDIPLQQTTYQMPVQQMLPTTNDANNQLLQQYNTTSSSVQNVVVTSMYQGASIPISNQVMPSQVTNGSPPHQQSLPINIGSVSNYISSSTVPMNSLPGQQTTTSSVLLQQPISNVGGIPAAVSMQQNVTTPPIQLQQLPGMVSPPHQNIMSPPQHVLDPSQMMPAYTHVNYPGNTSYVNTQVSVAAVVEEKADGLQKKVPQNLKLVIDGG